MPGKLHPCSFCNKVYLSFAQLNVHLRVHTGERPFKCDVCGKRFTQTSNLNLHKRTHSGVKPFQCGVCKKAFAHKYTLQNHENIHRRLKPYQCTQCSACFTQLGHLNRHTPIHLPVKRFQCKICSKGFGHQESLNAHKRTHSVTEIKLECENCGKKIYQNIEPTSERSPYSCKLCGSDFQNLYGLHAHTRQHVGELADKCTDCGNAFYAKLRGFSGECLYQAGLMTDCLFCDGRLPQKDLESHMRSHTREYEEFQFPGEHSDSA